MAGLLPDRHHIHPYVFTALFKIANIWKQPVSITRWLYKEIVVYIYIYNGILLGHKKEWNLTICNNMDGLREYYAKWNKWEKDKCHMILLYVESKERTNKTGTDPELTDDCHTDEDVGDWVKKVKRLRGTSGSYKIVMGMSVTYSIGNVVSIVITIYFARWVLDLSRGSLC